MKKFALLPLAALMLFAASCSDDNNEPVRPAVPTDPVTSVESVADQVTLNAPEQNIDFEYDGGVYTFTYSNGQKVAYTLTSLSTEGYIAVVRKISGAEEIVIPATVKAIRASDGEELVYRVAGLGLYQDGVSDEVKKVTISKEAHYSYSSTSIEQLSATKMWEQISKMPKVENIELENGYPGFCSIDGAVYTSDLKTLVGVPRGKSGIFTIAEDTEIVGEKAFAHCDKIISITFPAAITTIGDEAVTHSDMLVLINMLPEYAPATSENTFGRMAQTGLLRIPVGSKGSYFPERPTATEPVPPVEPPLDCTDEEWSAYEIASAEYDKALAEYETIMNAYERPVGFRKFKNVEEVTFPQ